MEKKGRLELWAGTIAAQGLEDNHDETQKNREAESSFARRSLWGWKEKAKQGAKKMRQTILGDHIVNGSDFGKLAVGLGMMAMGVGLPAAGYLIADGLKNKPTPTPSQPTENIDTDTDTVFELSIPD